MMDDFPIIHETQQKILTKFDVAFKGFLTFESITRRTTHIDFLIDRMTQTMVTRLRASVLQDPDKHERVVLQFEEYPRYETWRAHLVDSLPPGSFRRRFLSRLWGFADTEVLGKHIVHVVVAERKLVFPNAAIPEHWYPEELGVPGYIYDLNHDVHDPYTEEY